MHIAWRYPFDYEPEHEYRAVVRRQHLCRPPGCRGRRGPPGAAGTHNPVFVHIPPSGAPCFFDVRGDLCPYISQQLTKEQLVSVLPLQLNRLESQDVVVYMYAAVALDRILSMRTGGPITLMYACLIPVESPSSSNLQFFNRGRVPVRAPAPQRPPCQDRRPTERTAEKDCLMRCASSLSRPVCWYLIGCLSQALQELSSRRKRLSSGSTSPCFRD